MHVDVTAMRHTEIVYHTAAEIRQALADCGVPPVPLDYRLMGLLTRTVRNNPSLVSPKKLSHFNGRVARCSITPHPLLSSSSSFDGTLRCIARPWGSIRI
jgi:hypothetical protein